MADHSNFDFPRRFDSPSRAATFQVSENRRRLSHSPLRQHRRAFSSGPHEVVETLNARTSYVDDDDGYTGVKMLNQYTLGEQLGKGSYGEVHKATDQNGKVYAIKEFSKSKLRRNSQATILRSPRGGPRRMGFHHRSVSEIHKEQERGNPLNLIKEEIAIMKKLDHENIVHLYEVLDDPEDDSLYLVMELCEKGDVMKIALGQTAEPYDEEKCRCYFRDIILGIEYLHAQGICHKDIKPENLLLDSEDVLKIADFGVSEMFAQNSDMRTSKYNGSPAFCPPEICVPGHRDIDGKAADIWAMGVMLYCLRYGKLPFDHAFPLDLYQAIINDDYVLPEDENPLLVDLFHRILEKDPKKRIEMAELREHPWVTHEGFDKLVAAEENMAQVKPSTEEIKSAVTFSFHTFATVAKAISNFKSFSRRNSFNKPSRSNTLAVPDEEPVIPRRRSIDLSHGLERVSFEEDDRKPQRMDSAVAVSERGGNSDEDNPDNRPASSSAPAIAIELVDSPTSETFAEPLSYDT